MSTFFFLNVSFKILAQPKFIISSHLKSVRFSFICETQIDVLMNLERFMFLHWKFIYPKLWFFKNPNENSHELSGLIQVSQRDEHFINRLLLYTDFYSNKNIDQPIHTAHKMWQNGSSNMLAWHARTNDVYSCVTQGYLSFMFAIFDDVCYVNKSF